MQSLGFVKENDGEFLEGVSQGLALAATATRATRRATNT